jgi:hypothetical protein
MSRRNKPRHDGKRPSLPWLLIVGGAALLAVGAFLALRGSGSGAQGTPQISVDRQEIDFGYVKFNDMRSFEIAVTNVGDGALRFGKKPYIEILEGC